MGNASDLLGPSGPFATQLAAYEHRQGQLVMADAVERALREERILLCEAGTGTGKTLAYLVPALLSNKRVVVSTATKALQEQIAYKDIPLVARTLGIEPRVAVMKGLTNYVCRRRLAEFAASEEAGRPRFARALGVLDRWVSETETGELSELAGLGEDDPVWSHVTSSSETRIGSSCQHYEACFVTQMRREAETARLIVVNHHLFFADLALRGPHPARVLPDYDAVIFDEAHQIEDVASLFFGARVSKLRTTRLAADVGRLIGDVGMSSNVADSLQRSCERFWEQLGRQQHDGVPRVTLEHDVWRGALEDAYFALDGALDGALGLLKGLLLEPDLLRSREQEGLPGFESESRRAGVRDKREIVELLTRRTTALRDQLATIVDGGPGMVTWLEVPPLALSSTPVDLAPALDERVFSSIPAVVLTSATLTTAGSSSETPNNSSDHKPFRYVRQRVGLDERFEAEELTVESPFDFPNKAVLYTPRDLPPARSAAFLDHAAERVAALVRITGGGAFVLTTSIASMKRLHRLLGDRLGGRPLFLQGQAPKQALVAAFKASGDAVLVATQSFWEGVDVPGRALRLVVLEKLPFAVPTDPIIRARALAIERAQGNPFMDLFVPGAAIALKQGFGRLIRTRDDAGIVALLDERVHTKSYCRRLLRALPPVRRTHELSELETFWADLEARSR